MNKFVYCYSFAYPRFDNIHVILADLVNLRNVVDWDLFYTAAVKEFD